MELVCVLWAINYEKKNVFPSVEMDFLEASSVMMETLLTEMAVPMTAKINFSTNALRMP
jgi:hypothetical protein